MIFARGIKGNIKLNPAIKLWGTLLLVWLAVYGGFTVNLCLFRKLRWNVK